MTRQATLYISNHTERLAQEIAEHRGLPAERYRTRLYEALVSEEHSRMTQAQEAEMSKRRMNADEFTAFLGGLDSETAIPTDFGAYASVGWKDGRAYEILMDNTLQGGEEAGTVQEISAERAERLVKSADYRTVNRY